MPKTVSIGRQDFEKMRGRNNFYVDKTLFNKESGLGRYDIMLEPLSVNDDAFVTEFKAAHEGRGETLENAVASALEQIENKRYASELRGRGIAKEKIRKYGFAFAGSRVLTGKAKQQDKEGCLAW